MNALISNYLTYFLAMQLIGFLATFKFFQAAGKPVWAAAIPVYRSVVLLKLVDRPVWWVVLLYMPIVNNVVAIVLAYELLHVFNFRKTAQTAYATLTLGLYLTYLGFTEKLAYQGKDLPSIRKSLGETIPSIFFAIIVATVLRTFSFEAYTIPTSSMEKSLMVGDFLFVSKFHYGIRMPQTPVTVPLLHANVPFTETPTFLEWVKLPYTRLPKVHSVRRNESVVFNYPMEDQKPVDKRMNYIKRCVGLPGDTIAVVNRQVMVNGKKSGFSYRANPMWFYFVETGTGVLNKKHVKENFDINFLTREQQQRNGDMGDVPFSAQGVFLMSISDSALMAFSALPQIKSITPINALPKGYTYPENTPDGLMNYYFSESMGAGRFFPNPAGGHSDTIVFNYTADNYGPIYIPKRGDLIDLNYENYLRYGRAINTYEGNDLTYRDGVVYLAGAPATTYTFKMDYYWMMGDNRHNSEDSRFWGFVPEDHIVGKPVFIWMSIDKYATSWKQKIRWERVFTTVHFNGPRRSYFWPFALILAIIYGVRFIRKRKAAQNGKAAQ